MITFAIVLSLFSFALSLSLLFQSANNRTEPSCDHRSPAERGAIKPDQVESWKEMLMKEDKPQ